ncbi:MAG: hypothetical protein U0872_03610 [Planctomycetaceae bacterium]
MIRVLLIATAVIELGAGLGMLIDPASAGTSFTGSPLSEPGGLLLTRIGGAGLLAFVVACVLASRDAASRAARGVAAGALLYNIAAAAILAYARFGQGLAGAVLLPGIMLHTAMAIWCLLCLRKN